VLPPVGLYVCTIPTLSPSSSYISILDLCQIKNRPKIVFCNLLKRVNDLIELIFKRVKAAKAKKKNW
jgi:hypothetical protein